MAQSRHAKPTRKADTQSHVTIDAQGVPRVGDSPETTFGHPHRMVCGSLVI